MTAFQKVWSQAESALNDFGGELIEIRPQITRSHQASRLDPTRPAQIITGRYIEKPVSEGLGGKRYGERMHGVTSVVMNQRHIRLSPVEYAKIGYILRKDDIIALISRNSIPMHTIVSVESTDIGTLLLKLAETGVTL
jgi:hypothetical protein